MWLLMALLVLLNSNPVLPDVPGNLVPDDNPAAPGNPFTPNVSAQTPSGSAPAICAYQKSADAGKGWQCTSINSPSNFYFYGRTTSAGAYGTPSRSYRNNSGLHSLAVPTSVPAGSLYLVWPKNGSGYGYPVVVNKPELWHADPCAATAPYGVSGALLQGDTGCIYGANLPASSARVYMKLTGQAGSWINCSSCNPHRIDFTVPTTIAPNSSTSSATFALSAQSITTATAHGLPVGAKVMLWAQNTNSASNGWMLATVTSGSAGTTLNFTVTKLSGGNGTGAGWLVWPVYELWTHGGQGGIYGWSNPLYVPIAADYYAGAAVYNASAPRGSDLPDTATLTAANAATTPAINNLQAGTYLVEDLVSFVAGYGNGVKVVGAGKSSTLIKITTKRQTRTISNVADNGSGLCRVTVNSTTGWTTGDTVTIAQVTTTGTLASRVNGSWTVTVIDGTHADLQGSSFSGAGGGAYASGGIATRGNGAQQISGAGYQTVFQDLTIDLTGFLASSNAVTGANFIRCKVIYNADPAQNASVKAPDGKHFYWRDSDLDGTNMLHLGGGTAPFHVETGGTYKETNSVPNATYIWDCSNITVRGGTFQDENVSGAAAVRGTGRAVTFIPPSFAIGNIYIGENTTVALGVPADADPTLQNSGEQILCEGARARTAQLVTAYTVIGTSKITLAALPADYTGAYAVVTDGKGRLQGGLITATDFGTGGTTITLAVALAVALDTTSRVNIATLPYNFAIYGNTLQGNNTTGTASCGVKLYDGGVNGWVDGNAVTNTEVGLSDWRGGGGDPSNDMVPMVGVQWKSNTINSLTGTGRAFWTVRESANHSESIIAGLNIWEDNSGSVSGPGWFLDNINNASTDLELFSRNTLTCHKGIDTNFATTGNAMNFIIADDAFTSDGVGGSVAQHLQSGYVETDGGGNTFTGYAS